MMGSGAASRWKSRRAPGLRTAGGAPGDVGPCVRLTVSASRCRVRVSSALPAKKTAKLTRVSQRLSGL